MTTGACRRRSRRALDDRVHRPGSPIPLRDNNHRRCQTTSNVRKPFPLGTGPRCCCMRRTVQQLTTSTREGLRRCLRPLGAGTRFVIGQAIDPFRRRTHDHGPTVAMTLWTRRTEDLDGDTTVVARLLERAQCGEHDEALRLAENALKEPTGDLADGEAGMHFVRFVALVV